MGIKRIDLILPLYSQYQALHHFTKQMEQAFQECGINTRLISLTKEELKKYSSNLSAGDYPDCLFSFNAHISLQTIEDPFKVPFFSILVDSAHYFLPLANYSNIFMGLVDRAGVSMFQEMSCKSSLFMPHGVERSLCFEAREPKRHDVVFLATLTDYEAIKISWPQKFNQAQCNVMNETILLSFQCPTIPYYRLFLEAMERLKVDREQIRFQEGVSAVEAYLRGKERIDLLRSITKVKVDLFGTGTNEMYQKYLSDRTNIIAHPAVSYVDAIQVMKESKIVLHICSWIKDGGHERIFAAPACGALVTTPPNPFLKEYFKNHESILYLSPQFQDLDETLQEYLNANAKREDIVEKGREIVLQSHTWTTRARQILEQLPNMIQI